MALSDIVQVSISVRRGGISRASFGIGLLAAYHTKWGMQNGERVRSYTDPDGMIADGFYADEPAFLAAQSYFSQDPRPARIKIGRRASAFTQVVDFTPVVYTDGSVHTVEVDGEELSNTVSGSISLATACSDIAFALNTGIDEDVDAIKTNGVSTAGIQSLTVADFNGVVGDDDMVPARAIEFVFNAHADWDATNITVTGKDENGNTITELIAIPNGGAVTVAGVRRFKNIVTVSIPAQTGTNGTYTMGTVARTVNENYASVITNGGSTAGNQTLTGTSLNGSVGARLFTRPRAVALVLNAHTDWNATTAIVTGLDQNGAVVTENLAIPADTGGTVLGTQLFRRITSLYIPAQTGTGGAFIFGTRTRYTAASAGGNTKVAVTALTAGQLVSYYHWTADTLSIHDATADPGIATDLTAIRAANDDWYGLLLDSNSEAEINAAAAPIEALEKLFLAQSGDSGCIDSTVTTDVMSDVQNADYFRTKVAYHPSIAIQWFAAGWMGDRFPSDPGSDTWEFKVIAGLDSYVLTDTQRVTVIGTRDNPGSGKNGGIYTETNDQAFTEGGLTAAGEWVDIIRGLDWQRVRQREAILLLLLTNEKIPYTERGIGMVGTAVFGVLKQGVRNELFSSDPEPTVILPLLADIDAADRANRLLPGVQWRAVTQGAIRAVNITGSVTE